MKRKRLKARGVIAGATAILAITAALMTSSRPATLKTDETTSVNGLNVRLVKYTADTPTDSQFVDARIESCLTNSVPHILNGGTIQVFETNWDFWGFVKKQPYNPYGLQHFGDIYPEGQMGGTTAICFFSDLLDNPGTVYLDYAQKREDGSLYVKLTSAAVTDSVMYREDISSSPHTLCSLYLPTDSLTDIQAVNIMVEHSKLYK